MKQLNLYYIGFINESRKKKLEIRNKNYIDQKDPITNMQIYEEGSNTKRVFEKQNIFQQSHTEQLLN